MLRKVNKVNKDNPVFVSFLLCFVPTPPLILTLPFINFSKSLKPPLYFDLPVYYEPGSKRVFVLTFARCRQHVSRDQTVLAKENEAATSRDTTRQTEKCRYTSSVFLKSASGK